MIDDGAFISGNRTNVGLQVVYAYSDPNCEGRNKWSKKGWYQVAPGKTVQVWSGGGPTVKNSSITPRIQVVSDVRGRASLSPQSLLELSIGAGTQAVPTAEI